VPVVSDRIVAVVPVRSLDGGKTRLAGTLSPQARQALSRRMLRHVLEQTLASAAVDRVVVVSPDEAALAVARAVHPSVVALTQSPTTPGLNPALDLGRSWAEADGAAAMLVLFADLPRLTAGEVCDLADREAPVALAADRHGTGTNALRLRLGPGGRAFGFAFGVGSAALHLAEARRLGLEAVVHRAPGLSFDLDTADDWHSFVDGEAAYPDGVEASLCAGRGGRP